MRCFATSRTELSRSEIINDPHTIPEHLEALSSAGIGRARGYHCAGREKTAKARTEETLIRSIDQFLLNGEWLQPQVCVGYALLWFFYCVDVYTIG